jgi:hypothetical protein
MPKLSSYPTVNAIAIGDKVPFTDDPGGSPNTVNITYGDFFANVVATVTFANTVTFNANTTVGDTVYLSANSVRITDMSTPTSNADVVAGQKIWFDADYIYIAVANNTIRRVALTDF